MHDFHIDRFYFLGVNRVQKDPTSITMNKGLLKCLCEHLNVVFPVNTVYLLQSQAFVCSLHQVLGHTHNNEEPGLVSFPSLAYSEIGLSAIQVF